ncbi:hypothetical protein [Pseudactinotalea sp. HY158]|uniref:hypothetical protein n=1 Tax=Pseudactinotalea sp. HY158 TaxID=2654547 RepID=UPI00129CAA81|nr:hypothetical protein [Pseudactinotalea sp. HY158]QGH69481.1 hypothetical protein GCE65_08070 [Pseudactinotalea sp. HY158]
MIRALAVAMTLVGIAGLGLDTSFDDWDDPDTAWKGNTDGDQATIGIGEVDQHNPGADRSAGGAPDWEPGGAAVDEPGDPVDADRWLSQCSSLGDRLYCGIEFELNSDDPWAAGPPEEPIDIVAAVLARIELATFTIEPSPIHVQPAGGQVLVGMYTIFYTEPTVQRFSTRLLDRRVVLEVEPVQYVWDFGDDTDPVTTTDPGQAYPQHTITHTYTSQATVTPELATRWVGRVWIEGIGGWFAVRGQGLTTGHGTPIETITKQNRLVAGR